MFQLSKIIEKRLGKIEKHQLKNEGCQCKMCQKIIKKEMLKVEREKVIDNESECYDNKNNEAYISIIYELEIWEKYNRNIRYCLPDICLYQETHPIAFITKRTPHTKLKILRDQTKMHVFEVIRFLLEGFVYHSPVKDSTHGKSHSAKMVQYSKKYKNQCLVVGKYENNASRMFTLSQLESLFKSQCKYVRQGLKYMQTMFGTQHHPETRIRINLAEYIGDPLFERAKMEVKMMLNEIKSTDMDYYPEKQEIAYEHALQKKSIRDYLTYISLKIILMQSKHTDTIMSEVVFKYVSGINLYLWDIRVKKVEDPERFWAAGALKAFQYRLTRRMNMIDFSPTDEEQDQLSFQGIFSRRGSDIVNWLERSTENEWDQMVKIKSRLSKLQKQKKSLMQSQSFSEGLSLVNKTFKIRNVKKR